MSRHSIIRNLIPDMRSFWIANPKQYNFISIAAGVGVHDEMNRPELLILALTLLLGCSIPSTKNMTETENEESFEITFKPDNSVYSGRELKVIPVMADFSPTKDQQRQAMGYMTKMFPSNKIKSHLAN